MRSSSIVLAVAVCTAVAGSMSAAPPAPQSAAGQPPPFQSGVEAVVVDVSVVDAAGRPVRDLAPSDFAVEVAGRPRRVVSATAVSPATGRAAPTTEGDEDGVATSTNEGVSAGRLVVFVVDRETLGPSAGAAATRLAGQLVARLTPADRSALVIMPGGTGLWFTANHDAVRRALNAVAGHAATTTGPRGLALDEIRAIASDDFVALANVATRQCGSLGLSGTSGDGALPSSVGSGSKAATARVGGDNTSATGSTAFASDDPCTRQIQFEAKSAWQLLHEGANASLTAFAAVLARLRSLETDTMVVLITGGWPLEYREGGSRVAPLAAAATEARATVYTLFAPSLPAASERGMMVQASPAAMSVRRWGLDELADMTGGASYRADVGSTEVLDRLAVGLSGGYRLGIERDPEDFGGRARPMTVRVARPGVTVRAPRQFVAPSHDGTPLPPRLQAALRSPVPATGLGLRLASYVAPDPDDPAHLKIMLVGAASRLQPGKATLYLLIRDETGREIASGSQALGQVTADPFPFSSNTSVEPAAYTIRAAVVDASGAIGSVDHAVDARTTPIGTIEAGELILARVPRRMSEAPHVLLDSLRQDDQLALQLELVGDHDQVEQSGVVFQIARSAKGRALMTLEASRMSGTGPAVAQTVADLGDLAPGRYVARARVATNGGVLGELRRAFVVTAAPAGWRSTRGSRKAGVGSSGPAAIEALVPPAFALDQALAKSLVVALLDQVATRADARSPSIGALLEQVRTVPASEITVPREAAVQSPAVATFVRGLSRLGHDEVPQAAAQFRDALAIAPDLYPAIVYLGACYAAAGKDLEAVGAWQTALIREADVPGVHALLIDAFDRLNQTDQALAAIERARSRWPDAPEFKRRFVIAAFRSGQDAEGLRVLDSLQPLAPDDEPALALALQSLYRSMVNSTPIVDATADRERFLRYADAYRRLNGPSLGLVNAWVAAVGDGQ